MATAPSSAARVSREPPALALRHSAAVAVLMRMGFHGEVSEETFKGYIKGLRKLGVPFILGACRPGSWLAVYSYEHLMELAVALSLRTYNILPDSLVNDLIGHRATLHRLYADAWRQVADSRRRPVTFRGSRGVAHVAPGPYLDLKIVQHGRRFAMSGAPQLLTTAEALERFGDTVATAFVPGPVRISALVRLMAEALSDLPAPVDGTPLPEEH